MNKREIERKFTVEGLTYDEAFAVLSDRYPCRLDATSYDLYWKAPNVDFVRLRENSRELTVKVTDKNTVVDRIEENVKIYFNSMADCERLTTLLFGNPTKLTKTFSVFDTEAAYWKADTSKVVICLYTVEGDPKGRVFMEVEAASLYYVDFVVNNLLHKFTLTPVLHSLYKIFSEGL